MNDFKIIILGIILLISSSCGIGIPIIVPIPVTSTVLVSNFMQSDKKYFELYNDKVEDENILHKAWKNYSVEISPKKEYIVKVYNPDTKYIMSHITFKDSNLIKKTGKIKEWSDDGYLLYEGYYMNNTKAHDWKFYDIEKGYLKSEGKYFNNTKRGTWIHYNELGEIIKEDNYDKGELINNTENENNLEVIEESQNIIFKECNTYVNDKLKINCFNRILTDWRKTIYARILLEEVSKRSTALIIIKLDDKNKSNLKIIRAVNNEVEKIIIEEFEKMNFEFIRIKNLKENQGSGLLIQI